MNVQQKPGGGVFQEQAGALRYFSQAPTQAWGAKRKDPIIADTIVAIPFSQELFPQHAVGYRESFVSESTRLELSYLLLMLQACLSVKPEALLMLSAFTTDELTELLDDADAVRNMPPRRDTLFLIPLSPRQIEEAMTFIVNAVAPPPPTAEDAKYQKRKPVPHFVGDVADSRSIRSPTDLARAAQALTNKQVQSIDNLLTAPTLDDDASAIAADSKYSGHMLNFCSPQRQIRKFGGDIISATGTPVHFQNDPASYFTRENRQYKLDPIEALDALGCCVRVLNDLDQQFVFGSNLDANRLLQFHFPHMQAPHALVQVQLRAVIEAKTTIPFANVEHIHPRSFIENGLTMREIERGDRETPLGRIVVLESDLGFKRFPDPQQTAHIVDPRNGEILSGKTHDRNGKITQQAYTAQFRLILKYSEMLAKARSMEHDKRCTGVKNTYRLAFADLRDVLSDPSNEMFPASVGELYRERNSIFENLKQLKQKEPVAHKHVLHYYQIKESTAAFGGDSTARVMQHLVHVLDKRLGCMSNQIIPMIMLLLLGWNMVISCDNNKHSAALLGTPAAGKSQILEWLLEMINQCLYRFETDASAAADNYALPRDMDMLLRVWDEKAGLGKGDGKNTDSRQLATMKQMLSEGVIGNRMPTETVDEHGRKRLVTVSTMVPARSICIFLRNDKDNAARGTNPIESRLHNVQFKDPAQKEFEDKVLGGTVKTGKRKNINLAGQMIGTLQLSSHLPGHAGLDNGCDLSLLPIAVSTFVAYKLAPPLGRELEQLKRLTTAVCCNRVNAEIHRFEENSVACADFEEWELALLTQAHKVASPADIIAAFGIWVGLAGQDLAKNDLMESFVTCIDRKYVSEDDDGKGGPKGPAVMSGFQTHKGTHYILGKSGSGRGRHNEDEMLQQLATRLYTMVKSKNGGEAPSQVVVFDILTELRNTQIEGMPALMLVEFQDEETKSPEVRWAIAQPFLHNAHLPRTRIFFAQLAQLQENRKNKQGMRADYYSEDEKEIIIPCDTTEPIFSGSLFLAPHDYQSFPNEKMRRMAAELITPGKTANGRRRGGKIKEDEYNHELRFFERKHHVSFEVTQSNSTKAVRLIDPSVARSNARQSVDGIHKLEEVTLNGQCLRVNIHDMNAVIDGGDRPNALENGARMLQAIGYSSKELEPGVMRRLWYGVERTESGKIVNKFLEPTDVSDKRIEMRDLMHNPPSAEIEAFIGPEEDEDNKFETENLWPGTHAQCTFYSGDNLYGIAKDNRFKELGLVGPESEQFRVALRQLAPIFPPSRKRTHASGDPE